MARFGLRQEQQIRERWTALRTRIEAAVADGPGRSSWLSAKELEGLIQEASENVVVRGRLADLLSNALATGTIAGRPLKMGAEALQIAAEFVGRPDLVGAMSVVAEMKRALQPSEDGLRRLTKDEVDSILSIVSAQNDETQALTLSSLRDALVRGELFGRPFEIGAGALGKLLEATQLSPKDVHARFRIEDGDFRITKQVSGVAPKLDRLSQLRQAARSGRLGMYALAARTVGRRVSSMVARAILPTLRVLPVQNPETAAQAHYQSKLKNVTADEAFQHFLDHPREIFASARLGLVPQNAKLENGARVLLEEPGPPPMLFPLEVRIHPKQRLVRLCCLDGHPFAGENRFRFVPTHSGRSTVVDQTSLFEGSSQLLWLGKALGAMSRQTDAWRCVHQHLGQQLTGDATPPTDQTLPRAPGAAEPLVLGPLPDDDTER